VNDWFTRLSDSLLPPLPDGDPLDSMELEPGQEWNQVFEYEDGHRETGRVRYTGRGRKVWVNDHERILVPDLDPLTPLTSGAVKIVGGTR
jgi:hypothetical protein